MLCWVTSPERLVHPSAAKVRHDDVRHDGRHGHLTGDATNRCRQRGHRVRLQHGNGGKSRSRPGVISSPVHVALRSSSTMNPSIDAGCSAARTRRCKSRRRRGTPHRGHPAAYGRDPDAEPGRELGVGVTAPQVGQGEQDLAASRQPSPPRSDLPPPTMSRPGRYPRVRLDRSNDDGQTSTRSSWRHGRFRHSVEPSDSGPGSRGRKELSHSPTVFP